MCSPPNVGCLRDACHGEKRNGNAVWTEDRLDDDAARVFPI